VSAGSTCADKNFPGLYADVKQIASTGWLAEQMKVGQTCSPPQRQEIQAPTTTTTTTTPTATITSSTDQAVLLMGGDGYAWGKKVELWSPDQDSACRQELPELPDYRSYHASAMSDGKPVLCGGKRALTSCLTMNDKKTWETFAKTLEYRSGHFMVEIEGAHGADLVMGGAWSRKVEVLVNETSFLLQDSSSSPPRLENSCAASSDRGTIIVTGGKGGQENRKQVWEYNGSWSQLSDMPDSGRYEHTCTFISQEGRRGILVVGGSNGLQMEKSSLFLNLQTNQWEDGPTLPVQRWGAQMVSMGGRVFLLGGGDGRNYLREVEELDVAQWTWNRLPSHSNILFPRSDFSSLVVPASSFGCEADEGFLDLINPRQLK